MSECEVRSIYVETSKFTLLRLQFFISEKTIGIPRPAQTITQAIIKSAQTAPVSSLYFGGLAVAANEIILYS